MPLVTGDVDMSAIGTCTDVVDGHVLAFGHPLDGDGPCALPFCGGQIQGVIASYNSSFKIGLRLRASRGTLTQDQAVGIGGHLGPGPATVPVQLRVVYADGSSDQTYHFTVVRHPKLTPLLVATAMAAALTGAKELPPHHTVDYDLSLSFAGGRTVRVADAGVDLSAADLFAAVGVPLVAAADNPFGAGAGPERITGTLTVSAEERSAQILYATVPRSPLPARRGGDGPGHLPPVPRRRAGAAGVASRCPSDLPDGTYPLTVVRRRQVPGRRADGRAVPVRGRDDGPGVRRAAGRGRPAARRRLRPPAAAAGLSGRRPHGPGQAARQPAADPDRVGPERRKRRSSAARRPSSRPAG